MDFYISTVTLQPPSGFGSLVYIHPSVSNSGDEAMEEAKDHAMKQTPGWTPVQVTTMAMKREVFAEMARKILDS